MLLAYSKIDLYAELLDSDVPEDPHLSSELDRYFPAPLPERFGETMREHRLRREIIATTVANNVLHGGGTTFTYRLHEETGAYASEIARAYATARDIFEMRPQWAEIEALDNRVAAEVQTKMLLEGRRLIERGSRWLLRGVPRPIDIGATVARFAHGAQVLYGSIPRLWGPPTSSRCSRARRSSSRPACRPAWPAAWPRCPRCSPPSTSSRCPPRRAWTWSRWRRCTSSLATACSCTGCATASCRCRATTAGARWRGRRCATTSTGCTARSPREVLAASGTDGPAEARVDAWVEANPRSERALATLAEIRVGKVFDTTTLPVAVREVRNLLQAS